MYRAGIYCRASQENESSIASQIQMARDYLAQNREITEVKLYIDNGVSGSSFQRLEFLKMLGDIEKGQINLVLVKDLSRLGREQTDTYYYLTRYFPEKQIRVIAISDHYDSDFTFDVYEEQMEIKLLLNELYLRDLSKKVKSAIQVKRRAGEYTAKEAPFGYVKSKEFHNHLEVDPYAAGIVKQIYQMYRKGYGQKKISRRLNELEIPSPAKYKKEILKDGYDQKTGNGLWLPSAVGRILNNPVYVGAVVLRKFDRPSYKRKERIPIALENQNLIYHAHPAIITREEFDQVQRIRRGRKSQQDGTKGEPHKYAGLLFCGECKNAMCKSAPSSENFCTGYQCGLRKKMGKSYCQRNYISLETLEKLISHVLKLQIRKALYDPEVQEAVKKKKSGMEVEIRRKQEGCKRIYEQFMEELISEEEYLYRREMYKNEMRKYQAEISAMASENFLENKIVAETGRREVLIDLLDRIYVYPDGKIEFCFQTDGGREEKMV